MVLCENLLKRNTQTKKKSVKKVKKFKLIDSPIENIRMYANHYDKKMGSSQQNQREDSPVVDDIPMSPNTRRRSEFTMKQLQNGVLGRARSTLNSLGDVWKPKTNNSKNSSDINQRSSSSPSNQRALDFFMAWSRQKKSRNSTDKCAIDALNLMHSDSEHSLSSNDKNHRCLSYANFFSAASGKQVFGSNRNKPKLPISPASRANANAKHRTMTIMENISCNEESDERNRNTRTNKLPSSAKHSSGKNKSMAAMTQHKSLDIDDLLARDNDDEMYANHGHSMTMNNAIRRSFDDNINYLNCDVHDADDDDGVDENCIHEYEEKPRRRRTWNISLNESILDGDGFYGSPRKNGSAIAKSSALTKDNDAVEQHACKESVIKARLKLKKISVNDDILLNQTPTKTRGILFRHYSLEPNSAKERCNSPGINSSHDSDSSENRRETTRKKITFREPIVLGKHDGIHSDALERAKRFLEQYDRNNHRTSPIPSAVQRQSVEKRGDTNAAEKIIEINSVDSIRRNEKPDKNVSMESVENIETDGKPRNEDDRNENDKVDFECDCSIVRKPASQFINFSHIPMTFH